MKINKSVKKFHYISGTIPTPLYNKIRRFSKEDFTSIRSMVSKLLHEAAKARSKK